MFAGWIWLPAIPPARNSSKNTCVRVSVRTNTACQVIRANAYQNFSSDVYGPKQAYTFLLNFESDHESLLDNHCWISLWRNSNCIDTAVAIHLTKNVEQTFQIKISERLGKPIDILLLRSSDDPNSVFLG